MNMTIPPRKLKIMLESNPLNSRILAWRSAVPTFSFIPPFCTPVLQHMTLHNRTSKKDAVKAAVSTWQPMLMRSSISSIPQKWMGACTNARGCARTLSLSLSRERERELLRLTGTPTAIGPPSVNSCWVYIYIYMVYLYIHINTYYIYIYICFLSPSLCLYIYIYMLYVCHIYISLSLYIYIYMLYIYIYVSCI